MRYLTVLLYAWLSLATMAASAAEPAAQAANSESPAGNAGAGPADASKTDAAKTGAGKPKAGPAGDVVMSGLSILGNDETPKELVIVPWKSSQLADAPGISRLLDDSTQPVDKDVFLRELSYHDLTTADPDGE